MNNKKIIIFIVLLIAFALSSPWGMTLNLYSKVYYPATRYEVIDSINHAYISKDNKKIYICMNSNYYDSDIKKEKSIEVDLDSYIRNTKHTNTDMLNKTSKNIGVFKVNLPANLLTEGCISSANYLKNNDYVRLNVKRFEHEEYLSSKLTKLKSEFEFGEVLLLSEYHGFIYVSSTPLRDMSIYKNSKIQPKNDKEYYVLFGIDAVKTKQNKLLLIWMPFTVLIDIIFSPIEHLLLYNSR